MIDLQTMRRMAAAHPVVVVDNNGEPMDRPALSADLPVPGLLVSTVNEAVKQVDAGSLIADLDRDSLWAVAGFALDVTVLDALGEGRYSAADLIRAVPSAGFNWKPTIL
jgi:hypothetical protein